MQRINRKFPIKHWKRLQIYTASAWWVALRCGLTRLGRTVPSYIQLKSPSEKPRRGENTILIHCLGPVLELIVLLVLSIEFSPMRPGLAGGNC